ncbi:hypothetical protein BS50DRAFT_404051 [Corynespora cassiicola Philippines]|uniref:Uncharacterized protein n=1 Tax=Corynespora cassiicola Philippines TaxID=1448308 RepID=A0A2T2NKU4_CORCC|nr:hypothetical protein BS50DRAFT_404051 [Corynespora cassiicola Philippines]
MDPSPKPRNSGARAGRRPQAAGVAPWLVSPGSGPTSQVPCNGPLRTARGPMDACQRQGTRIATHRYSSPLRPLCFCSSSQARPSCRGLCQRRPCAWPWAGRGLRVHSSGWRRAASACTARLAGNASAVVVRAGCGGQWTVDSGQSTQVGMPESGEASLQWLAVCCCGNRRGQAPAVEGRRVRLHLGPSTVPLAERPAGRKSKAAGPPLSSFSALSLR